MGTSSTARADHRRASSLWRQGPARPRIEPGTVHVWRAQLGPGADLRLDVLSPLERARAARIVDPRGGALWARGRTLLRVLLAAYLDGEAGAVRLTTSASGKPSLVDEDRGLAAAGGDLEFNLSHSGETALYALSCAGPVGVDVELAGRRADWQALARRAFGPRAAERRRASGANAGELEFLRSWTRREAAVKCSGAGLAAAREAAHERLWVGELDVGRHARAALALEREPTELRCFVWRGGGLGEGTCANS